MPSPGPASAAGPGCSHRCSHRLCWTGGEWGDSSWEEQSNKWHVGISCLSSPFLSQTPPGGQGRGNICMANTSFAGKKKKKFAGGAVESTVQERTSQGLLQQQLGSLRAET